MLIAAATLAVGKLRVTEEEMDATPLLVGVILSRPQWYLVLFSKLSAGRRHVRVSRAAARLETNGFSFS